MLNITSKSFLALQIRHCLRNLNWNHASIIYSFSSIVFITLTSFNRWVLAHKVRIIVTGLWQKHQLFRWRVLRNLPSFIVRRLMIRGLAPIRLVVVRTSRNRTHWLKSQNYLLNWRFRGFRLRCKRDLKVFYWKFNLFICLCFK